MATPPNAAAIPRTGRGTSASDEYESAQVADWDDVTAALRSGDAGPFWLCASRDDASTHVRPLFAAWADGSFFFTSNGAAAKTGHVEHNPDVSVSVDLDWLHLVVEGRVERVVDADRIGVASRAMRDVFEWPTRAEGDVLDADYGAPTSLGPPYQVYELVPTRAYGFPTRDQVEPTRWTFQAP
ncbi:MAG TPA: pyridoxamine 5'-phosphate oxidase family protein [Nitriliruptoraceae bacterium]|nr:pyridoxamine 5'-phosphate oxidase family protein [Nitriliruptoraceae bacterium]